MEDFHVELFEGHILVEGEDAGKSEGFLVGSAFVVSRVGTLVILVQLEDYFHWVRFLAEVLDCKEVLGFVLFADVVCFLVQRNHLAGF